MLGRKMTAEIAILNKDAIALAADSAITISVGMKEEKIFDSAEKLFELSNKNPIGIMVYNGMQFMEVPLPSLIRQFRNECPLVDKVEDAANAFLGFLCKFGDAAPREVKERALESIVAPFINKIFDRALDRIQRKILSPAPGEKMELREFIRSTIENEISIYNRALERLEDANFIGGSKRFAVSKSYLGVIKDIVERVSDEFVWPVDVAQKKLLVNTCRLFLKKCNLSRGLTGVVVAGFGKNEIFPTLLSYEIDGMVCDKLKYIRTNYIDIDRRGTRAIVLPFAQKEMVERFLYGLDASIQRKITQFCKSTVSDISKGLLENINFDDDKQRDELKDIALEAEDAFVSGLQQRAFDEIRSQSQSEIEDMVEFMPKSELAKMAEALVNLTSIKRRVSRGMETVGGPIDVAVISQAEGFVWIKRKHYFPQELNSRYMSRVQSALDAAQQEIRDGQDAQFRSIDPRGGGNAGQ